MAKQRFFAYVTCLIALSVLLLALFQLADALPAAAHAHHRRALAHKQQAASQRQTTVPEYVPMGVEYPATGAFRAHYFEWEGEQYSVTAFWRTALTWNIASPIAKRLPDGTWEAVNTIPTSGARECTPFVREIDGEDHLVFLCAEEFDGNLRNIVSRTWLWHGEGEPLECIQEIATVGAYGATVWESGNYLYAFIPHYLGPSGHSQSSQLLVWNNDWSPGSGEGPFSQVMTLETSGAKHATHTQLGNTELVFVCQAEQDGPGPQPPDSALYAFYPGQGQPLVFNQTVPTVGCASATWFHSGGVRYLAVANQGGATGYEQYSTVFYFGAGGELTEAASVLTYGATHWTFESRSVGDFLTIANYRTLTTYDPLSRQYEIYPGESENLHAQMHFLGEQSLGDFIQARLARGLDLPEVIYHSAPGSQPITLVPIMDLEASGAVQFAREPDFQGQPRMMAVRFYNEDEEGADTGCLLREEEVPPLGRYRTDESLTPEAMQALWAEDEDAAERMLWVKHCEYAAFAGEGVAKPVIAGADVEQGADEPGVRAWNVPLMQFNDRSVALETASDAPSPSPAPTDLQTPPLPTPSGGSGPTDPPQTHSQPQPATHTQSPRPHTPTRSQSQSQTPRDDDSSGGGGGGGSDDALTIGLAVGITLVLLGGVGGVVWWKKRQSGYVDING